MMRTTGQDETCRDKDFCFKVRWLAVMSRTYGLLYKQGDGSGLAGQQLAEEEHSRRKRVDSSPPWGRSRRQTLVKVYGKTVERASSERKLFVAE